MRIVLDTNVLLISLKKGSTYRPILDGIIKNQYDLIISNEILSEYLEIIGQKTSPTIANNIGDFLINRSNVKKIDVYYHFNLIKDDPDDNKFVDCAITGNVKYVVTNDKHFNILKEIPFPKVDIIKADDFLKEIEAL
ncbi:MAG: putative toxin-antitoxin system toxin component, PIN family [Saprospiraceae bacterium]